MYDEPFETDSMVLPRISIGTSVHFFGRDGLAFLTAGKPNSSKLRTVCILPNEYHS